MLDGTVLVVGRIRSGGDKFVSRFRFECCREQGCGDVWPGVVVHLEHASVRVAFDRIRDGARWSLIVESLGTADGVLIVFAFGDAKGRAFAERCQKELVKRRGPDAPYIVVALKSDLWAVGVTSGGPFPRMDTIHYAEASAERGIGVRETMLRLIHLIFPASGPRLETAYRRPCCGCLTRT